MPEHRGLTTDPESLGFTYLGGYLLHARNGQEYAVGQFSKSGIQYLFLQRLTGRDAAGRPRWEVMDAISVPAIPKDHSLVLGTCGVLGNLDGDLIAIVRSTDDVEEWRQVWQSWRASPERGRFSLQDTSGMYCLNEGYGV